MDILQLKYFKTVANTLNISQAAKLLFISQSSLSQTIQHLEAELGYSLFDRNGKRIQLNENGTVFLNCVDKMETALLSAQKELADRHQQLSQQFTLSIECASRMLPGLMQELSILQPETTFHILQNRNDTALTAPDLRIFASVTPLEEKNRVLLLEERILLAVPRDNALCSLPMLYSTHLGHEHFLILSQNWGLGAFLDQYFSNVGFVPNALMVLDNPSLLREFLQSGYGLAFVPEITWGFHAATDSVQLLPVEDMPMKRYVYLEWSQDMYLPDCLKACIAFIRDYFHNYCTLH